MSGYDGVERWGPRVVSVSEFVAWRSGSNPEIWLAGVAFSVHLSLHFCEGSFDMEGCSLWWESLQGSLSASGLGVLLDHELEN